MLLTCFWSVGLTQTAVTMTTIPRCMCALMEAGAHMDATNAFKQTAYELLDEKLLTKSMMQPFNYITLQCLAARALDKHKIPYKGFIPEELEAFIELH